METPETRLIRYLSANAKGQNGVIFNPLNPDIQFQIKEFSRLIQARDFTRKAAVLGQKDIYYYMSAIAVATGQREETLLKIAMGDEYKEAAKEVHQAQEDVPLAPQLQDKPRVLPEHVAVDDTYTFSPKTQKARVNDGDTFYVDRRGFRIAGIDALESDQGPVAGKARDRLAALMNSGDIKVKILDKDRYGRPVVQLTRESDGLDIAEQLLREDLVRFTPDYKDKLDPDRASIYGSISATNEQNFRERPQEHPNSVWAFADPAQHRKVVDQDPYSQAAKNRAAEVNGANVGKTAADTEIEWKTDVAIEGASPYDHLQGQASIAHLSKLYDYYYSSADVKVWIVVGSRRVMVDLIVGIGYNYQVNSVPVYTIGSRFPAFFSRGNSIGTGSLVFPFKSTLYLKNILKYVFNEYNPTQKQVDTEKAKLKKTKDMTDEEFQKLSFEVDVPGLDVIDVGSIVTPFDIEIRFDNSNAFQRDPHTSVMVLKGCKITGDHMDVASTQDGNLLHGCQFMFKQVLQGE